MSRFFFSFFFGQSGEAYRWRVCYQWGLPRLVYVLLLYLLPFVLCGAVNTAEEEDEFIILAIATVFVEQPLASAGYVKDCVAFYECVCSCYCLIIVIMLYDASATYYHFEDE